MSSRAGRLSQPRLLGYALAGALNGATLFTYIATSPGLIMGTYGLSATVFPWIFGFNAYLFESTFPFSKGSGV